MAIVYLTSAFMLLGVFDKIVLHNRLGYGPKFDEGIMAMGSLALSMAGIMCLAPLIGRYLAPAISPVFRIFGTDPAMIAGAILACDTGGYPLAVTMTQDTQIAMLSGIFVGSMMGATIVFSIPVSLGMITEADKPYLARGFLCGFISVPVGAFVSALTSGISPVKALVNLIPLILVSLLLSYVMARFPERMLKIFHTFARIITIFIHTGLAAGIFCALTGITLIPGLDPIGPQLETCGIIAITLAGAYPMVQFITTYLSKPLTLLGSLAGVSKEAAAGMVACLANNIPLFGMLRSMEGHDKVVSVAFSVCASFALGDHLGFAAAQCHAAAGPMITGKLAGGMTAIVIARLLQKTGRPAPQG